MEVRFAKDADVDAIIEMLKGMHEETLYKTFNINFDKAKFALLRLIEDDQAALIIATDNEEVVGLIAGSNHYLWFSDDKVATEQIFFVKKSHRKKKVGYSLVSAFIEWAKQITNYVSAGTPSGVGKSGDLVYEQCGMTHCGNHYFLKFNAQTENG